jgi:phenylacetate-CoA ligase
MIVPEGRWKPPYSRLNLVEHQRLFSIYAIRPENAGSFFDELKRFRPDFLEGFPSAMCLIAGFMKDRGVAGIDPRAIITYAETLFEWQRELLEDRFGCPVFDWYGTSEGTVHIMQCEKGSYHVCAEFGCVEVVDPDGKPVSPGQEGEIVGTSFVNHAHPLIRFGTGDLGVASDRHCPCGRGLPTFERVIGRMDDVIVTPDGRHLGRLDSIFKNTFHIRESQIIQDAPGALTVLVVRDPEYGEADTENLLKNLRHYVGTEMEYRVRFVDNIDRTAAGKFRAVICRIPRDGEIAPIAGRTSKG